MRYCSQCERDKCQQEARVEEFALEFGNFSVSCLEGKGLLGHLPSTGGQIWEEIRKYSNLVGGFPLRGRWHEQPGLQRKVSNGIASTKKPSGCIAACSSLDQQGRNCATATYPCDKHTKMKSCSTWRGIMSLCRYLSQALRCGFCRSSVQFRGINRWWGRQRGSFMACCLPHVAPHLPHLGSKTDNRVVFCYLPRISILVEQSSAAQGKFCSVINMVLQINSENRKLDDFWKAALSSSCPS